MVKHVVILGAGVAGLHCAQRLAKKAPNNLKITLVDQSDVHVLRADLYEVATAFNKEITEDCMVKLKSTVATPIRSLIDPRRVQFVQDSVVKIDAKKKKISFKKLKPLSYDFLVVSLGSITNFFGIKGIEEHAYPLKSVHEALAINCQLDHLFYEQWKKKKRSAIYINIGGGGATGVEMASELYSSLQKLCKKYKFPRSKVHVQLIQSGHDLGGLDDKGTDRILARLEGMGVCVYRGYRITKVTKEKVTMMDAKKKLKTLPSSVLIWTAGVKIHPVIEQSLGEPKKGGAIEVTSTLEAKNFPGIFAAGDNAFLEDPKKPGVRVPMLAHHAWEEGMKVADNIVNRMNRRKLEAYGPGEAWMILPLGGKFAFFKAGRFLIGGFWSWFLRRLVILHYHHSVMNLSRAFKKWKQGGKIFEQND